MTKNSKVTTSMRNLVRSEINTEPPSLGGMTKAKSTIFGGNGTPTVNQKQYNSLGSNTGSGGHTSIFPGGSSS